MNIYFVLLKMVFVNSFNVILQCNTNVMLFVPGWVSSRTGSTRASPTPSGCLASISPSPSLLVSHALSSHFTQSFLTGESLFHPVLPYWWVMQCPLIGHQSFLTGESLFHPVLPYWWVTISPSPSLLVSHYFTQSFLTGESRTVLSLVIGCNWQQKKGQHGNTKSNLCRVFFNLFEVY